MTNYDDMKRQQRERQLQKLLPPPVDAAAIEAQNIAPSQMTFSNIWRRIMRKKVTEKKWTVEDLEKHRGRALTVVRNVAPMAPSAPSYSPAEPTTFASPEPVDATYREVPKNSPAIKSDRLLQFVAFGLFFTGAAINGYYTYLQGANSILIVGYTVSSAWLLMLVGIMADIATYSLPNRAAVLWRSNPVASIVAWLLCIPLVAFAFLNNTGFTSTNLTDTARDRAQITTPELKDAQKNLEDAKKARDNSCVDKNGRPAIGPVCNKATDEVVIQQRRQDAIRDKIAADANPQSAKTASLVRWASFSYLSPSVDDISNLFLLLFAALPLSGGLIRMVARRR